MRATAVTYEVLYNGTNITGDILPYVMSITYTDNASNETDEVEITLDDALGVWQFDWYPTKGDKLSLKISSLEGVLNCGIFTIDQLGASFSSDGDIITIKALAAGIDKSLRTKNSYAHENKTIREIANTIATNNNLILEGFIPNIRIDRKTQYHSTDLYFLLKLANDYGYTFSIRENKLIFTSIFELEGNDAAHIINRKEVKSASFTDKTAETFKAVEIQYHNPLQKAVIAYREGEKDPTFSTVKKDTLVIKRRVENLSQAEILAKVALYKANSLQHEGMVDVVGNVFLVAGINIEMVGFGVFSGKYFIKRSTHNFSKDEGYITTIEIKRVGLIDKTSYK